MKTVAITSIFSNPIFKESTARGLELIYLKKMLDNNNVIIIGKKGRNSKDMNFYYDYTDHPDYDNLFIQLSTPNFFGGVVGDNTIRLIENIDIDPSKINIFATDPRIKPVNPARILFDRFGKCEEHIEKWDNILSKCNYLMPGKDIYKFWPDIDLSFANVINVDFFGYIFKHNTKYSNFVEVQDKEYDVIYYGDKRGSYREKKLRFLFKESTKNLLVGYKSPKVSGDFIKKVQHVKLQETINRAKVNLIIADEEHEDNVTTFRFYEGMASSSLCAIDLKFDPNRELIKDPILKDLLYIERNSDIKKLANSYSKDLIELQHKELKRILDEVRG